MDRREHLRTLVTQVIGGQPRSLAVEERPLRGGIDGAEVSELQLRFVGPDGRRGVLRLVAKRLLGTAIREAAVYQRVVAQHAASLAPPMRRIVRDPDGVTLYMAAIRRRSPWPWREVTTAARVLEAVAELHRSPAVGDLPAWDYEAELGARAAQALEALERARRSADAALGGASLRALRRLVAAVPAWRRHLLSGPFAPCAIHGDLHTGNVVAGAGSPPRITLLDWGRSRVGSPLEDVCSWLQSVAFWEPAARRRHDTLLGAYLAARGAGPRAARAIRDAYWLAGASNALAGALAYHLDLGTAAEVPPRQRARSLEAARDWLRIVRRADAVWTGARQRPSRCAPAASPAPGCSPA